jgi:hypothetical protein
MDLLAAHVRQSYALQTLLGSSGKKSICTRANCAQQKYRTQILQGAQCFNRSPLHEKIWVMLRHVHQAGNSRENSVLANKPANPSPRFRQRVCQCGNKFFFVGARVRALAGSTVRTSIDACINLSPTMCTEGNHGITPGREWLRI